MSFEKEKLLERQRKVSKGGIKIQAIKDITGLGKSTISEIISGKYRGKTAAVQLVDEVINKLYEEFKPPEFVTKAQVTMESIMEYTLIDNEFTVIVADSGHGKTVTAERFMETYDNILYIKIIEGLTYNGVLTLLLRVMGQPITGSKDIKITRLLKAVKNKQYNMIIVDEADLLVSQTNNIKTLLTKISIFREVWEDTKTPIVLLGLPEFVDQLRTASQSYMTNRVGYLYQAPDPTIEELRAFWEEHLGMEADKKIEDHYKSAIGKGCFRNLGKIAKRTLDFDGNIGMALKIVFS